MKSKKKIFAGTLAILLFFSIIGTLFFTGYIKFNTPSSKEFPVWGVDVSEYQGEIDWQDLEQQNVQFSFIKATEGSRYADPFFDSNWENVSSTSILYGAYHFFSFDSPAAAQAEHFINTVDSTSGMLPPVVDIEFYGEHKKNHPDPEWVRGELTTLLETLESHYGVKPILYATRQSYSLYISGHYPENPIWIRDVYLTPSLPPGEDWLFWQYSDKGILTGYHGPEKYIDLNVYSGNLSDLEKLCVY